MPSRPHTAHHILFIAEINADIAPASGIEKLAVISAQSGTASALMGTLMFVCGGIAAPLAGFGGETMLKMSIAMAISYAIALFFGLIQSRAVQ